MKSPLDLRRLPVPWGADSFPHESVSASRSCSPGLSLPSLRWRRPWPAPTAPPQNPPPPEPAQERLTVWASVSGASVARNAANSFGSRHEDPASGWGKVGRRRRRWGARSRAFSQMQLLNVLGSWEVHESHGNKAQHEVCLSYSLSKAATLLKFC